MAIKIARSRISLFDARLQGEADPLFEAEDSKGKDLGEIGLRRGNVMGSYAHIIDMEEGP